MEFRGLSATLAAPHRVNPQLGVDVSVGPRYCGDRRWVWPTIGLPEAAIATLLAQSRPAEMSALVNRQGHLDYQLTAAAHQAMADDVLHRTNPWSGQGHPPIAPPGWPPAQPPDAPDSASGLSPRLAGTTADQPPAVADGSMARWRATAHRQAVTAIRAQLPADLQPLAVGPVPEPSSRFTVTGLAHHADARDPATSGQAAHQAATLLAEPGTAATRQVADDPVAPLAGALGEAELRFATLATPPTKPVHVVAADLVSRRPGATPLVDLWLTMGRARRLLHGVAVAASATQGGSPQGSPVVGAGKHRVDLTDVVSLLALCPSVLVRSAIAGRPDHLLRHLVAVAEAADQCFGPVGWDAHAHYLAVDPQVTATVQAVHRALESGLVMVQVASPAVV